MQVRIHSHVETGLMLANVKSPLGEIAPLNLSECLHDPCWIHILQMARQGELSKPLQFFFA